MRLCLDRVVHRRIDVLADELYCHIAAALEGHVGQLLARGLLQHDRDDLVFLLGAGAAHFEGLVGLGLDCVEICLRCLVR